MKQGFSALLRECRRRRDDICAMIGSDAVAVITSAEQVIRSNDEHYPFRQDSDFWYLTGFPEPDAMLVLRPGSDTAEQVLFCRERNAAAERWDGARAGLEGAVSHYGLDDAFPIDDIDDIMPGLLEGREKVYFHLGREPGFDQQMISWLQHNHARKPGMPEELISITHLLHELRLIKSRFEQQQMRRSGEIAAAAHCRAMRRARHCQHEHELMAEVLYEFHRQGCGTAYAPIVGAGANGCVLHYIDNNGPLGNSDLVLIDAGCEYQGYASDITRTFPLSGRFSVEQKAVYEIVLAAQEAAIAIATTRHVWDDVHQAAVSVIAQGLLDLQLLKGDLQQVLETRSYEAFFMHKTGHWLGLDVHDVGDYRVDDYSRQLEPGMVMTVEPGIYISPDVADVDTRWHGIGIRIEDDVLVTKSQPDVLTNGVPKTVSAIEALMAEG